MSDTTSKQAESAARRGGLSLDSQTMWVLLPALGVPLCWVVVGAALATGTQIAGGSPGGWPSVPQLWNVGWRLAADGARLDEAWLLVSGNTAVAAASWLWLLVAAYAAGLTLAAVAVLRWSEAGWTTDFLAGFLRFGGGVAKQFRRKTWPIRPPYSPVVPGPGVLLGRDRGQHVVASGGRPVMVLGPTGSGKTRCVIAPNAGWWPGPVVATSVKTDLAEWTLAHRKEKGTCYGYDPTGRLWEWMRRQGITPVVWDPVRLLRAVKNPAAKREMANLLAQFLTSQSSSHDAGSQGIWATLAQQYLTEVMVIADEMDFPLVDALSWVMDIKGFGKDETLPFAKLGPEGERSLKRLRTLAGKDDRFQGSIEITLKEVTGALEFTAASPDTDLVPADLTTSGEAATLYLVADHLSMTTHKPVFASVCRWLFHVTETYQPTGPDTRPARSLFALDELANLARLADLPAVLSTIRSRAQVIIGIQERSQLDAGWGRDNAKTLVGNCPVKLQLPGSSDASALRDWATLAGTDNDDSDRDQVAAWRTIPKGHARVLADEHPAFQIQMADPDRWLADTPPTVEADAPEPDADAPEPDGDDEARPFNAAATSATAAADRSNGAAYTATGSAAVPEWQRGQAAASAAATDAYEAALAARERGDLPEPDAPVTPVAAYHEALRADPVGETMPEPTVFAGNTPRPETAPAAMNGQQPVSALGREAGWRPPPIDDGSGEWDETLAVAAEQVERGTVGDDDMEDLDLFLGTDGRRYAVHEYGYMMGLDDVPDPATEGR